MRGETARMFLHSCLYSGVSGSTCGLFIMIFSVERVIYELLGRQEVRTERDLRNATSIQVLLLIGVSVHYG